MKWRAVVGGALTVLAATVFIVELGEFLLLARFWLFVPGAVVTSPLANLAVLGTTLVTICATFLASLASLASLGLRRAWPTLRAFVGIGVVAAATQGAFLVIGMMDFDDALLVEFFKSKQPSFAAGLVAALILVAVGHFMRPWQTSPTAGGPHVHGG